MSSRHLGTTVVLASRSNYESSSHSNFESSYGRNAGASGSALRLPDFPSTQDRVPSAGSARSSSNPRPPSSHRSLSGAAASPTGLSSKYAAAGNSSYKTSPVVQASARAGGSSILDGMSSSGRMLGRSSPTPGRSPPGSARSPSGFLMNRATRTGASGLNYDAASQLEPPSRRDVGYDSGQLPMPSGGSLTGTHLYGSSTSTNAYSSLTAASPHPPHPASLRAASGLGNEPFRLAVLPTPRTTKALPSPSGRLCGQVGNGSFRSTNDVYLGSPAMPPQSTLATSMCSSSPRGAAQPMLYAPSASTAPSQPGQTRDHAASDRLAAMSASSPLSSAARPSPLPSSSLSQPTYPYEHRNLTSPPEGARSSTYAAGSPRVTGSQPTAHAPSAYPPPATSTYAYGTGAVASTQHQSSAHVVGASCLSSSSNSNSSGVSSSSNSGPPSSRQTSGPNSGYSDHSGSSSGASLAPSPYGIFSRHFPSLSSALGTALSSGQGCVGLQNLGNTCFMNSILQSLNAVPELVSWFCKGLAQSTGAWSPKAVVAPSYSELISQMWAQPSGGSVVSPSSFVRRFAKVDSRWGDGSQQDSQEFLHSLLGALQTETNRVVGKPQYRELDLKGPEEEQAAEAEAYARSWSDSVVDDIFGGMLQSSLVCQGCKRQSHCFDPFVDLAIPIPNLKAGVSLQDCLRSFVETEKLDGTESYKCEHCKTQQPHTKRLQIFKYPRVLILTLKRFSSRSSSSIFSRFRAASKNNAAVALDADYLDLAPFCNPSSLRQQANCGRNSSEQLQPLYQLISVSHHSGSLEGGHYTAAAKSPVDGQWRYFNDTSVRKDSRPSSPSASGYVLFYRLAQLQ